MNIKKIDKNKINLDPRFGEADRRKVVLFEHVPRALQWALYLTGRLGERDSYLLGLVNPKVRACLDYEAELMANDRLAEAEG